MDNFIKILAGLVFAAGTAYVGYRYGEESSKQSAFNEGHVAGESKAAAKYALKVKRMNLELGERFKVAIGEREHFFDAVLAMCAVGAAAANCAGSIKKEARATVEQFVAGVSGSHLPSGIRSEIDRIFNDPPNLLTAFSTTQRAGVPLELCQGIVELLMNADGMEEMQGRTFLAAWQRLASAA